MNDNQGTGTGTGALEYRIANSYLNGSHGFLFNRDVAEKFLIKSAELGFVEGQYCLGRLYLGDNKLEQALRWFLSAANLGHNASMFYMSYATGAGIGCKVNVEESKKWFIKAEASKSEADKND